MKTNKKIIILNGSILFLLAVSSLLYSESGLFKKMLHLYNCPFKSLTGYPCATCGFTRSVLYIFSGNLFHGFLVNPLAFFLFFFSVFLFLINLFFVLTGSHRYFLWPWKTKPEIAALWLLFILLITWIYKLSMALFLSDPSVHFLI
ncbi:MAG: DUF2752 domain-containing protein [Candidatus Aureabacteria bacterium]|nr:DUF2752 domain-containing protein [Candidatus Auribacterota bacterium]